MYRHEATKIVATVREELGITQNDVTGNDFVVTCVLRAVNLHSVPEDVLPVLRQAVFTEKHRLLAILEPLRREPLKEFIPGTGILNRHYTTESELHVARCDAALKWMESLT